jgi:hypothetical protein
MQHTPPPSTEPALVPRSLVRKVLAESVALSFHSTEGVSDLLVEEDVSPL